MSHLDHHGNYADSAGTPWAGRSFGANEHVADDGSAPPELAAALARWSDDPGLASEVVAEISRSRLLIPLLAELGGDLEIGPNGVPIDKKQELSIVAVAGRDGRRTLPVFTSVDAMRTWNPIARPVPVDGVRVALAAVDDGCELVVVDPASPTEFLIRRPAVWAIAQGKEWRSPVESHGVDVAFKRSIGGEPAVRGVTLISGDSEARGAGPELIVRLELAAGLSRDELDATIARLSARWAADDVIATEVDSLAVRLVAAS
ncbi:MAG TPA: SseB family protein [Candidatus Lumbricidophila sp.]|nr:SseB family protein [Candidatus Lumbricidophila sp.]